MRRFEVVAKVANVISDTSKEAESRIVDSDIGSDSSHLVKNQILQQTAAAVLAQANQQPALALQLLRG